MADDVLLHNATFLSMDPDQNTYDWVLVHDGRFAKMGTGGRPAGTDVERVDLQGATVLPGFVEAHGHPTMQMSVLSPTALDIRSSTCTSAEAVMDTLRGAIEDASDDGWVVAFGWDPLLLPDLPEISSEFLTELSPDVPLSVMHYSAHTSWSNRAAMERLDIDKDTPDPPGSSYGRHDDGSLDGSATELPAATNIMGPAMDPGDDFDDYLQHTLQGLAEVGLTTTGDLAFNPQQQDAITRYFATHHGPVRVRSYEMSGARDAVPADGSGTEFYRQVGVKIWKDGSPWVGNIETSFPYQDSDATHAAGIPGGHHGCSNYSHDDLVRICESYYPKGWQIACHVHGDIAVDDVLDVFEQVDATYPREGYPKFRIEHAGAMTAEQVRRAHRAGVAISYFPTHVYYYGEVLRELFGDRADEWVAAGHAVDAGIPFSLHNDSPVTAETPLLNIQTAVTRRTRTGTVMGEKYGVPVLEALKAHTIYAAEQLLSDHEVGSIEKDKCADLVVLSDNPLDIDPHHIADITVLQTWLGGQRTH